MLLSAVSQVVLEYLFYFNFIIGLGTLRMYGMNVMTSLIYLLYSNGLLLPEGNIC